MTYVGDFRTGKTIRKMWNSNAVAGGSITRATNGTISVYKDGSTTQSTTGVTDTEDFDSLTGVHLVAVDTSADGTFYSAGSDFEAVLSAASIDGVTINATLFSFSLENRSHLMPTTDGRKLDVSAGGEAGLDWANVGSPTTAVDLSGTTIKTTQKVDVDTIKTNPVVNAGTVTFPTGQTLASTTNITAATGVVLSGVTHTGAVIPTVTTLTGHTAQTGDTYALANGANGFANIKSDTAAILVDTGTTLDARIPAALVGGRMDSNASAISGSADAADRLEEGTLTTIVGVCAAGGSTTTIIASSLTATAVDDQFVGRVIAFRSDTTTAALRGQATAISDYVHATKTFTVTAMTTAPASTDAFVVI